MPAFSLPLPPPVLTVGLRRPRERSPTPLTSVSLSLLVSPFPLLHFSTSQLTRKLLGKRKEMGKVEKQRERMVRSHSFGAELDPRWIVGALTHSTSELLRTL